MPLRSLNRRSLVRQAVALAPGLPLAACNPLSGAPPSTGATRDYSGVVLQYLGDGTDGASLKHHERAMQEFFAPDHPGARVEVVTVPGPSATVDKLQVLLAADTPPDGVGTDDYRVANLVQRGVLLDLTTYQETDRRYNAGDLYPGAWRAAHYRNRLYGLPIGMFGPVVVFNEDHFDKAGVPYPPADWRNTSWTWDRMRQDAQRLAERDAAGQLSRAGFAFDARFASRLSGHFAAYGAPLVDRPDDPTACLLGEPKSVELIQLLSDLQNLDRTAPPAEWYGFGDDRVKGLPGGNGDLFREGKAAMAITLSDLSLNRKTNLRWDYAPLPRANATGRAGGFAGVNLYMGLRSTRHPDVVWRMLAAMGHPQRAGWEMRDPERLATPVWRTLQADYAQMKPPDGIGVNIDIGEYGTPSMKSGAYNDVQDAILNGLAPVWRREAPVRQAVAEIVRKVNDLLRQAQR